MDIQKEKEHVYNQMDLLMEERREITRIYYSWKERLDYLNKLEARGLEQVDIKGYLDYHNQQALRNLEREAKFLQKQITEEPVEVKAPTKEEKRLEGEREQERLNRKSRPVKSLQLNTEKVMGYIASVLKEAKEPMPFKDLHSIVEERVGQAIGEKNFQNNLITRAMKKNKNIYRPSRGYYAHKEAVPETVEA